MSREEYKFYSNRKNNKRKNSHRLSEREKRIMRESSAINSRYRG